MVRELAAKSSGAQIKIMSDREKEKQFQDCIVTIAGSLKNKQDACSLIIEQLEAFRLGAPANQNSKTFDKEDVRDTEGPYEKEYKRHHDRSDEKDYERPHYKNVDRRYENMKGSDRYLDKRQEFRRHEESRSPNR